MTERELLSHAVRELLVEGGEILMLEGRDALDSKDYGEATEVSEDQ